MIYPDKEFMYESEYLNGWKNGKGKEYYKYSGIDEDKGELIFDGEFLDDKRWKGKGKEIGLYNETIFKGEYLNGQYWNGTKYNYDLDLYGPCKVSEEIYTNGKMKLINHI